MRRLVAVLSVILALLAAVCLFLPAPKDSGSAESTAPMQTTALVPTTTIPVTTVQPQTTVPEQTQPPETTRPEPADADFVPVADYVSDLREELAYATVNNFTGQIIYDFERCYLRYGTVTKLMEAAELLAQQGFGIVIWDGYRPVYAQQRLWDICPDPTYVSKPGTGKQLHCRGIAVDITLYDLTTGEQLEMPSGFDDFSSRADRNYSDCTQQAAENAALLEDIMVRCGFEPYSGEWWHYSDIQNYPIEEHFDPAAAG